MLGTNLPAASLERKIQGNASLMIAWQLQGKNVLVVGGGREAAIRTFFALDASAVVTCIAPKENIHPVVQNRIDNGLLFHKARKFHKADLFVNPEEDQGKYTDPAVVDMVLVCVDDHGESRKIANSCRELRIPVNCADIPELCDFYFMAQYRSGDLQIGVSTNGGGPRLGARIRNDIVSNLDPFVPEAVSQVSNLRQTIRKVDGAAKGNEDSLRVRMGWISRFCDSWSFEQLTHLSNQSVFSSVLDAFRNKLPSPKPPLGTAYTAQSKMDLPPQLNSFWWCPSAMGYQTWGRMLIAYSFQITWQIYTLVILHLRLIIQQLLKPFSFISPDQQKELIVMEDMTEINTIKLTTTKSFDSKQQDPELQASLDDAKGSIYLVGAGPGEPSMLTLEAREILNKADLVVSDRLISPQLIDLLDPKKLILSNFKIGGASDQAQNESNDICLDAARKGKMVVRFKTGDPFVFARGGEEVLYFRSKGFEARVVPGLTSVFTVPESNGIPITHRGIADQVLVLSGRGQGGVFPNIPIYDEFRTTIILMSLSRLSSLSDLLIKNGYPTELPSAVIEKGTWKEGEKVCKAPLCDIAQKAKTECIENPALLVVGRVCGILD